MFKNKKTFWGVVGVILLIGGTIWTIPLGIRGGPLYGLIITGVLVLVGILLIAWNFSD